MKTKEKILSRFLAVMASVCLCMFVWTMTMTIAPENNENVETAVDLLVSRSTDTKINDWNGHHTFINTLTGEQTEMPRLISRGR